MNTRMRKRIGYLFLMPTVLIILVFIVYPIIKTVVNSFFDIRIQTMQLGTKFVGLSQYKKLFSDRLMWSSLGFTLRFTAVSIILETILGMVCALVMNRPFRAQGIVRAAILVPWAIPTVVSGLMWSFMFADNFGIINFALQRLGLISQPIHWVTDSASAFWSIVISDVWKTAPYMSLMLLSGLLSIPGDLYEAASIDGANAIKQFIHITLPMMKQVLMVSLLFRVIASFRIYDLVAVLTGGGPGSTTKSLTMYTIENYFTYGNLGYGSAAAMLTFFVSMILALFFMEGMKSNMEEPKIK